MRRIVIVGASLAGVHAAQALRREGFAGEIVLVGSEVHPPYDRPPLSKEVLRGDRSPEQIALRTDFAADSGLRLELGVRATALDLAGHRVSFDGRPDLGFDGLVIATGATVRTLPGQPEMGGLHTLRTIDDALALREAMAAAAAVVVVGAGFIGAEVAAAARARGLQATIVEAQTQPLAGALGEEVGGYFADLHRRNGTKLLLGEKVALFEGNDVLSAVVLESGRRLGASLAVVGVGVRATTDWLEGSGLDLDDGIVCDAACRALASGVPVAGVVAAGDVARVYDPRVGRAGRVEHWTNAVQQGAHAAKVLLRGESAGNYTGVPQFWSDQYGVKIQSGGWIRPDDEFRLLEGDPAAFKFTAVYLREGRLTGVLSFARPARFVRTLDAVARGAAFEELVG